MKKSIIFFLLTIISLNNYAQADFQKGYFIDNTNTKIECFIKNLEWKGNPTNFDYTLTENGKVQKADLTDVKEFAIYNNLKYIREEVPVETSSEAVYNLSKDKNPIWKDMEVFLKVLVEGKASLYSYDRGGIAQYYYSLEESSINPLVFKSYLTSDNKIGQNNHYKQQLWNDLKCPDTKMSKIERLTYTGNSLIPFFSEFNMCSDSDFKAYEEKDIKSLFSATFKIGVKNSSYALTHTLTNTNEPDYGSKLGIKLGIEGEFRIPFHKNEFAVVAQLTYQDFKGAKELPAHSTSFDYTLWQMPIGIRYYLSLSEKSKIFVNGSYVIDMSYSPLVEFELLPNLTTKKTNNYEFGLGYKYNDKFSLEVSYQTDRNLLIDHAFWESNFKTMAVLFGYTLF